MIRNKSEWNQSLKDLKSSLTDRDCSIEILRTLMSDLHGFLHSASISKSEISLYDELWQKRERTDFTYISELKIYSIAWHIWHMTRIEDITCSHLVMDAGEIFFDQNFKKLLNVPYYHTGNSMVLSDMEIFNKQIVIKQLGNYRTEVGKRTQEVLRTITKEILKEKVSQSSLKKISECGSVIPEDQSLLDFWGKKKISGIVTMPLTRHLLVHINSAFKLLPKGI